MENLVSSEMIRDFYAGKKVFITGHTGFKGSWLSAALHSFGAQLCGYALEPEQPGGLYDFLRPLDIGESIIGDVRDKNKLSAILRNFKPDIIFHLAAQPLVRRSYEIPAETFDINVTGTANLLESVIDLPGSCAIVAATTDKVYHNREQDILYKEEDALGGRDPYSASKACAELTINAFRASFFDINAYQQHKKAVASVRAGNVIGGGDWSKDRLLPDIVNSLANNSLISIRNPNAVRPWQHVLEAISGYLTLAMKLSDEPSEFSRAFNFGPLPADHLTVKELVEKTIELWGNGDWEDVSNSEQPHEAELLKLDISRALNDLRWKPRLNAETAIRWTINWYKQEYGKKADYSFYQIKEYFLL